MPPPLKQYVEKPRKILAGPYDPTSAPDQAGVCRCQVNPSFLEPRAHIERVGWVRLAPGAMMVFDAAFPDRLLAILTVEQFEAIYGNVPGADVGGVA